LSIQNDLTRVKDWAQEKAQGGQEPPWAWYQYMKLIESVNAILAGMAATTTESSPQLAEHQGKLIQLKAARCSQGTAKPILMLPKYRCPCDAKVPKFPVSQNRWVIAVSAKPISYISLSETNNPTRIPFMPNHINALDLAYGFEIQRFKRAPIWIRV
jgi:hypothetical protein